MKAMMERSTLLDQPEHPAATRPLHLDFVVGGVQKAGTTSLFGYLSQHPQLLAPLQKETHFFDNETFAWPTPDLRPLRRFFPDTVGARLAFDATPIYLFWPPSLARIRAHNPAIKLIFLFRDPIERAWSHWRMESRRNAEPLTFSQAIREGRKRLDSVPSLDRAWRVFSYVERGFYARQLGRLFDLFPREQILLLSAHDLETDHAAVLARIASFLGITPFPSSSPRLDHRAPVDGQALCREDVAHLRTIFREEIADFAKMSGVRVDMWLTMRSD